MKDMFLPLPLPAFHSSTNSIEWAKNYKEAVDLSLFYLFKIS